MEQKLAVAPGLQELREARSRQVERLTSVNRLMTD